MAEGTPTAAGFTAVDKTRDQSFFIEFLDSRTGIEGERGVKELVLGMLALENGTSVLDVGCGTGDDAREIAELVAPKGKVVGMDHSASMIEECRRRAADSKLAVEFIQGDACAMDFPDKHFDRARADRVFVHLKEPDRALAEMVRVLKPGGRVVVTDVDCGTFWVDSPYRNTTEKVFSSFTDSVGSGWVGRSLPRMFQRDGLRDIECAHRVMRTNLAFFRRLVGGHLAEPSVAARFEPGELAAWWQDLSEADAAGHFHYGFSVFSAVGRKP